MRRKIPDEKKIMRQMAEIAFDPEEKTADRLRALDMLSDFTKTEITYPLRGLAEREVRFTRVIDADQMIDVVKEYVK